MPGNATSCESVYILSRDNPQAAISKFDGVFRIPELSVGELEFQVWQGRMGQVATGGWPRGRFKMQMGRRVTGTSQLGPSIF